MSATISSYPQCTELVSRGLQFINPATNRTVVIKPGERCWISSTQLEQNRDGRAMVCRKNANARSGWYFPLELLTQWFDIA